MFSFCSGGCRAKTLTELTRAFARPLAFLLVSPLAPHPPLQLLLVLLCIGICRLLVAENLAQQYFGLLTSLQL